MYDFVLPGLLTLATVGLFRWLDVPLASIGSAAMVNSLSQLLGLMIGFYLAALAAVATFTREGIDDPLKGGDATLVVTKPDGGGKITKVLSYRQFISYLFGYLSFLSLISFTCLLFLQHGWPLIVDKADSYRFWDAITVGLTPVFFTALFFAIAQLLITSLLGIYFLAERLQSLSDPDS